MKKKNLLLSMVLIITILFTGCGMSKNEETTELEVKKVYELKHPTIVSADTPYHKAGEAFRDAVAERSGGRIKVTIYPNGELAASGRELVEMVRTNAAQMIIPTPDDLAQLHPELSKYNVFSIPYLFKNQETIQKFMDSEFGDELRKLTIEKAGLKMYDGAVAASYAISTNVREIKTPADLKNQNIRVQTSPPLINLVKAWGANPIPMAYSEVYTGLQQGVVDGMMTRTQLWVSDGFMEVQKYLGRVNSIYAVFFPVLNYEFYESLPEDLQKILDECMLEYMVEYGGEVERADEDKAIEKMREKGIVITEYSDEELKPFKDLAIDTWDSLKDEIGGGDYLDRVIEFLDH